MYDTETDKTWRKNRAAEMLVEGRRIKAAYRFPNGMVIVFDQYGQQMEAYQGHINDVREMIQQDAPQGVVIQNGIWP